MPLQKINKQKTNYTKTMGEFTKNTTITLASRILTFAVSIAISVTIARILGPEGKGIYSLAILLPALIVTFTNIGIGPATVYYISKGQYSRKEVFGSNLILSLLISAFSVAIGFVIIFFFKDLIFSGVSRFYLLLTLALIPITLFFQYANSLLLGAQKIKQYNLISIIQTFTFLILVGIALWVFKAGITGAIIANLLALFLVCTLLFVWVRKLVGGIVFKLNPSYIRDSSTYGIKAFLGNVLAFLNYRLDMFLVNIFMNPLAVGYYSIAVVIAEKLWMISQAASIVLFPKVASMKNERERKNFTPIVSRNVLLITLIGATVTFFLSRWIILLLFSEAYLPAVKPLQILLPGIVALSISRVLANDIAGRGRPMLNTYLSMITVAMNLGLNIIWIPRIGINGAAWATTVSYTIQLIGRLFIYSKISGNSIAKTMFLQKSDILLYKKILSGKKGMNTL